jgi:hypothetical protein
MGTMMKTTVSTTANVRARGTVSGARGYGLDVFFSSRAFASRVRPDVVGGVVAVG